jgi:hypothetical protein
MSMSTGGELGIGGDELDIVSKFALNVAEVPLHLRLVNVDDGNRHLSVPYFQNA